MSGELEIVIVEDNPTDAELMKRVLKKQNLGDKLVFLHDGVEALEFFLPQESSASAAGHDMARVILLDLKLPKVDGIEVLRRLKSDERTKRIPVVVLTSSSEARDLLAAYNLGVNSYVSKPIRFEEFAKVIAELGAYWTGTNRVPVQ